MIFGGEAGRMRRGAVGVFGVVAAGVLAVSGAAVPVAADAGPAWGDCPDLRPVEGAAAECAALEVPMARGVRGHRAGTVTIALSRVPARRERQGTLLVNPGGPGSPGRELAAVVAAGLPDDLRDSYDVVGFDPRGTGASVPAIACDPGYFDPVRPDSVPADAAAEEALLGRAADYARACGERNGPLLDHVTTVDSARDVEDIRRALDVDRIDYLGYSYGTYLGAVYATLHPDRVRRLVLDSVVNPDTPWYRANLAQSRTLDAAARNFFGWTARHDGEYGLGATRDEVAANYYAARAALADEPVAGVVGPTEFESVFLSAAYTSAYWPVLARALSAHVVAGDSGMLETAYERLGENADSDPGFGAYLATECTDAPWPRDYGTWREDGAKTHTEAPFAAWNNIWYNAPCMFWPGGDRPWFQVDGSEVEDALIIHATEDGPTPIAGAHAMRERFPTARLVVEDGGVSHGVSLNGNACVDRALADYLRDGTLPEAGGGEGADLTCAPLPEPGPHRPAGHAAPGPGQRLGS
ncbi:alpha/beta fold hydrolase [Actinorugispora endophytica]|uniref:TAP-like protein n=1 Tax=Actinorugispora endophytica TaxID=1605990 RepID=A0A4R6V1R3_9ACTN|nr:alpha/beta fold hydrolase [Actinorugispora endophytica]TDQ53804.1 TAP-like protein [Actinorugispora endophytica]